MTIIAGFLEALLHAVVLASLSLGAGGIVFLLLVMRPLVQGEPASLPFVRRSLSLVAAGGLLAAVAQMLTLAVAPLGLAYEAGQFPLDAFLATSYARAGIARAVLGCLLGGMALRLRGSGLTPGARAGAALAALFLVASGAWVVHGASRLDHAGLLMAVTVIHQGAGAVWIGGSMHLAALWRLARSLPSGEDLWFRLVARFSFLAMGSVVVILASGFILSRHYIGDFEGLVGTAYGAMVLTKAGLMGGALFLGGVSFLALRRWRGNGERERMPRLIPPFTEAEVGIGTAILAPPHPCPRGRRPEMGVSRRAFP